MAKLEQLAREADKKAGQTDDALYIAFVGVVRIPENDNVAALDVAPAYALYFVIDQFVDQQTLAVMKLRQHRSAFDHNRLNEKDTKKDEDDDDQENVANQFKTFGPKALTRLAPQMRHLNIAVVRYRDEPKI